MNTNNQLKQPIWPNNLPGIIYGNRTFLEGNTVKVTGKIDLRTSDIGGCLVKANDIGPTFQAEGTMSEIAAKVLSILIDGSNKEKLKNLIIEHENYEKWLKDEKHKKERYIHELCLPLMGFNWNVQISPGKFELLNVEISSKSDLESKGIWDKHLKLVKKGYDDAYSNKKYSFEDSDIYKCKAYEYGFHYGLGIIKGMSDYFNSKGKEYGSTFETENCNRPFQGGYDFAYDMSKQHKLTRNAKTEYRRVVTVKKGKGNRRESFDDNAFNDHGEFGDNPFAETARELNKITGGLF